MPISVKINVDKIDRSRFFKGEKGRWLDLILLETPNSKYGDYMVKHSRTQEERQKGGKDNSPILGNAKILKTRSSNGPQKAESPDDEEW